MRLDADMKAQSESMVPELVEEVSSNGLFGAALTLSDNSKVNEDI